MLTKREKRLYHLDKMQLINIIIAYESKLEDMELNDMVENEKDYTENNLNKELSRSEEAMARYTKKLFGKGKNAKNKVIESKREKTTKLRKR